MATTRSGRMLASAVSLIVLAALAALFYDARPRPAGQDPAPTVAVAPATPPPARAATSTPTRAPSSAQTPSPKPEAPAPPAPSPTPPPNAAPAPTSEPTPTAEPTAEGGEPTAPPPAVDDTELDALRVVGGPAEVLLPAADQDQIDNPLHNRWWHQFRPAFIGNPEWEWSNKAELWDELVEDVWADAKERYGTALLDRPGTVWPGSDTSAYAVWGWSSHDVSGGYGHIGLFRVGLEPEDPEQRRPDVGVYTFQIEAREVEEGRFEGRLNRVVEPFLMSGEMIFPDETRPYIAEDAPPAEPPFERIQAAEEAP